MRSIKNIRGNDYLFGVKLCRGRWYKIYIGNKFWLVRFYNISDGMFNHQYDAYAIYGSGFLTYGALNGVFHNLCLLDDISGIERVSLDYVKSFGILV